MSNQALLNGDERQKIEGGLRVDFENRTGHPTQSGIKHGMLSEQACPMGEARCMHTA